MPQRDSTANRVIYNPMTYTPDHNTFTLLHIKLVKELSCHNVLRWYVCIFSPWFFIKIIILCFSVECKFSFFSKKLPFTICLNPTQAHFTLSFLFNCDSCYQSRRSWRIYRQPKALQIMCKDILLHHHHDILLDEHKNSCLGILTLWAFLLSALWLWW